MRARFVVGIAALVLLTGAANAAPPSSFALTVVDGKLGGPGGEIIRARLKNAQFILWGEDHGFADSPILARAVAREGRPLGFKYLVYEVGPISTRMVRETLTKEGIPGVARLVHDVPLGLPFLSLKEDNAMVSDFLGKDARGQPYLWGVDQEFIGSPGFHLKRLVEIAPDAKARGEAVRLLAEEQDAAATGQQQRFLLVHGTDADFDALALLFKGQPEAESIIAEMKQSAGIYQAWMHDHNYDNNTRRAELLAKNFLADYRSAADPMPKVTFKMGVEHVLLGTTWVNSVDLGTLATEMARANDKTALRICFLPAGGKNLTFTPKPGNPTTVTDYKSKETTEVIDGVGIDVKSLARDAWTLIPLEPVRQSLDTKGLAKLTPFARQIILGFDYLVTTPDAKPATFLY